MKARIGGIFNSSRLQRARLHLPSTQVRFRTATFFMLVGVVSLLGWASSPMGVGKEWPESGHITSGELSECSGLVKSRQYEGIFWAHNDSGNASRLYALRANGEVVASVAVNNARNTDWEDIAIDDDGFLYVGDFGNNFGKRKKRRVYKIREPNPTELPMATVSPVAEIEYKYDGARFDCEAMFVHRNQIYLISKTVFRKTSLYRLDPPKKEGALGSLVELCTLPIGQATGADLSKDGKKLAVCGYGRLWVLDVPDNLASLRDAKPQLVTFPATYQVEACAFDGEDVVITAESREVWRVAAGDMRNGVSLPKSKDQSARPE